LRPHAGVNRATHRLLLISYHFLPGQAAGALRWQKLAGYAAERGWGLDVITLEPEKPPELPAGTRVYGVPQSKVFLERLEHIAALGLRALRPRQRNGNGNGGGPHGPVRGTQATSHTGPGATRRAFNAWLEYSRDLGWAQSAAAVGCQLVAGDSYSAVISCGPPHMAHWAGRLVAERTGLPFIMDLRDPWSLVERLAGHIESPLWHRLARRYERPAVARASLIAMNTEPARQAMARAYPAAAGKIITVTNGFDEDEVVSAPVAKGRFTVLFAGSVYLDRNPRLLLQAAAIAIKDLQLTPEDFRIEFIGHLGDADIGAMAHDEGMEGFVGVSGFRPRHELRELLAKATLLVSLNQDSNMAIPSKIFEYMQYPAWLVALAEKGTATELLLRGTGADVVPPADTAGLAEVLRRRYLQHAAGVRPDRLTGDSRFSRRTQATLLFDRLEQVAARPTANRVDAVLTGGVR